MVVLWGNLISSVYFSFYNLKILYAHYTNLKSDYLETYSPRKYYPQRFYYNYILDSKI